MSKIRPSSLDIPTWNRGTFPFDAFEWQDPQKNAAPHLKLRSPWVLELSAGTVDTDEIADGAVTNVKVNAAAEISASKIKLTEITSLGNLASAPSLSGLTGSQLAAAANIAGTQLADDTIPESKITAATLTSKSLKFTDNIHENDDPLPDGDKLLDCIMPSAKWSDGTEPEDTKNIVFEPWYIGSVLNPRVKTNFHGAIGVWKATTNSVDHGDCTDASNAPHITGKTAAAPSNATFANDTTRLASDGFSCYRHTISATGSQGFAYISNSGLADLNGTPVGETWTVSCEVYVPSTGGPALAEVVVQIAEWSGAAWTVTDSAGPTGNDRWERISVTKAIAAGTIAAHKGIKIAATASDGEYVFVRNVQMEQSSYATPFTPSTRAAGTLQYIIQAARQFTVECWAKGYVPITTISYNPIWYWSSTDCFIAAYWDPTNDRIAAYWGNLAGSTYRISASGALTAAQFNGWNHVKVVVNMDAGTIHLWLNGSDCGAGMGAGSDVTFIAYTAPSSLSIGYEANTSVFGAAFWADGLICDLRISSTADTSTAHYTLGRPYYDESSLPCANFGARLSATGLDLYKGSVDIVDQYGREILISNRHGLKAKDACGEIIHDIPNAIMSADWKYAGHIILRDTGDTALTSIAQGYIDTNTSRTWTSSTTNTDLSSLVGNLTIRAIIATCINTISLASAKQSAGCFLLATAQYASSYGGTPLVYNSMGIARHYIEAPIAALLDVVTVTPDVIVPVFYSSGVPYVTWNLSATWSGMTASSAAYDVSSLLVIKGFLV